jgi:transcriptional regulator with XRE-family HTH domain
VPEDIREAEARRRREEGDRVRQIREALGDKQPAFAARLTAVAARLGLSWVNYDNTAISRLETGRGNYLRVDDLAVIISVDPEKRTVEWLAGIKTPRRQYGAKPYRRRGDDGKEESA